MASAPSLSATLERITGIGRTDLLALDRYLIDPSPVIAVGLFWSVAFPRNTVWIQEPIVHREAVPKKPPDRGFPRDDHYDDVLLSPQESVVRLPQSIEDEYIELLADLERKCRLTYQVDVMPDLNRVAEYAHVGGSYALALIRRDGGYSEDARDVLERI